MHCGSEMKSGWIWTLAQSHRSIFVALCEAILLQPRHLGACSSGAQHLLLAIVLTVQAPGRRRPHLSETLRARTSVRRTFVLDVPVLFGCCRPRCRQYVPDEIQSFGRFWTFFVAELHSQLPESCPDRLTKVGCSRREVAWKIRAKPLLPISTRPVN